MGCAASRELFEVKGGMKQGSFMNRKSSFRRKFVSYRSYSTESSDPADRLRVDAEEARILAQEIIRREQSAVRKNVTRFEIKNAKANFPPVLRDIRAVRKDPDSKTVAQVNLFEEIEAAARRMPPLQDIDQPMSDDQDVHNRVMSFEEIERESKPKFGPTYEEMRARREQMEPRVFPNRPRSSVEPLYTL